VNFGIQIAGLSGAKIDVVYIIDTTPYYSIPLDQVWTKEVYEQLEKMGHEITAEVEETAKAAGLDAESIVLKGNPAERILNFAEEQNVDMIVVGSHGTSEKDMRRKKTKLKEQYRYYMAGTSEKPELANPAG
jgi:nucleotide-binding universal stress UspA family protein